MANKDRATAERTTAAHRARRIAKDLRTKSRDLSRRARRLMLRKLGAVRRLERRLEDVSGVTPQARLLASLAKARAAHAHAKAAA